MRAGWRPERRNRKIGTADAGWRKQNSMVVPNSRHDEFYFYERLGRHTANEMELHGQTITFLVEPARPGSTYGCSARDVLHVLGQLPAGDVAGLKLLVLRQPTRKQEIISPVWGRCVYAAMFGSRKGPTIMLEAMDLSHQLRWPGKLSVDDRIELERIEGDGHHLIRDRRGTTIKVNASAVRSTILYHTLIHEVGHWVDWKKRVLQPKADADDPDRKRLKTAFFVRPHSEIEKFANSYADRHAAQFTDASVIPFGTLG